MSALDDFKRNRPYAVCVDSDGCAMDTMNIKHFRCFGPCMVEEWGLEPWRDAILERWNVINLYSGTPRHQPLQGAGDGPGRDQRAIASWMRLWTASPKEPSRERINRP